MSSEYYIDTEIKNRRGDTPLITASRKKYISIVKLLLEKGVDINAIDEKNCTSLDIASWNGCIEIVKLLLEEGGVNIDVNTPLTLSLSRGHREISKLFIERGVDITQEVRYESLIIASQSGYTEIVKLLIEKGVNVNSRNEDGDNPLSLACENGHIEVVKCLLEGIDHSSLTRSKLTEQ